MEKTNTELIATVASGTEEQKKKAWDHLLVQVKKFRVRCCNACMCGVAAVADDRYRQKAWETLLVNDPFPIDFAEIVVRSSVPHAVQNMAWDALVSAELEDDYYFRYIIDYAREPHRSMALDAFIARGYPRKNLRKLLHGRHGKESEYWKNKIAHLL